MNMSIELQNFLIINGFLLVISGIYIAHYGWKEFIRNLWGRDE